MIRSQAKIAARDDAIIRFIAGYHKANGFGPSMAEITAHVGLTSRGSLHKAMSKLRRLGVIRWRDRLPRSMEVVKRQRFFAVEYGRGKWPKLREIAL